MFFSSTAAAFLLILSALACGLIVYNFVRWLLKKDAKVDEVQKAFVDLACLLTNAKFTKCAAIVRDCAVIAVRDAVDKVKMLLNSLQGEDELLLALDDNFIWQLGKRLGRMQDRTKIIDAIVTNPDALEEMLSRLPAPPVPPVKESAPAA